jgi:uncharacterized repeat protein (TIGR01451 family)
MRSSLRLSTIAGVLLGLAAPVAAQPYDVSWWTVDTGGAMGLAAGPYVASGTAGQHDAGGPFAAGSYAVTGGFWANASAGGGGGNVDLALTVTDAPDPVGSGSMLDYTVVITNLGPATATGMTVVTTLPPGVAFVSSTPGGPICTPGSTVTCTLGALPATATHTVTIRVGIPAVMVGSISLTSTVTGSETDPVASNNSETESTQVLPRARGELSHGTSVRADLAAAGPIGDVDLYRIRQQPYASYEVIVDAASGDLGSGAGPVLQRVGPDGFSVLQTSTPVGTGSARALRWVNTTANAVDDQFLRIASASCSTDCGPDDVYRVRAYETTATIPRFNNSATQVTVVLVHNAGDQAASGRLYFWSAAGGLLHSEPWSLAAKGLLSVNAAGIPALVGASGSVTVTSDAPYGTLAGKAVALEPASGYSFDSIMAPRPR